MLSSPEREMCHGAGREGMQVLTWELPRGSCRMPKASQAGSGMRSITPGLTPGARR